MRTYATGLAQQIISSDRYPDDVPLESKMITRNIASYQRQLEARNFEIRKNVLKYDDVLTEQRQKVYDERRMVLQGEDLEPHIKAFRERVIANVVAQRTAEGRSDQWDLEQLWKDLSTVYPMGLTVDEVVDGVGGLDALTSERLTEELTEDIAVAYEDAEANLSANDLAVAQLGEEPMRTLERRLLLAVVDQHWREHLYEMDYLKEGIGLRAMAQRDPLVEYANEGAHMFKAMMDAIREDTIEQIFAYCARFEAQAKQAAREAAQAREQASIMGDTGRKALSTGVTYSDADTQGSDNRGNRAERRRRSNKKRKRR